MFELRQSKSTGEHVVRASYITETLDELRNRTVLTMNTPPAIAPLFIPGCSGRNATFDCTLADFLELAKRAIDRITPTGTTSPMDAQEVALYT